MTLRDRVLEHIRTHANDVVCNCVRPERFTYTDHRDIEWVKAPPSLQPVEGCLCPNCELLKEKKEQDNETESRD